MIRSTRHSLKFANQSKLDEIGKLVNEYRRVLSLIVDDLWDNPYEDGKFSFSIQSNSLNIPSMLDNSYLKKFKDETYLSQRYLQSIGKQTVSMIKAATKKRKRQLYMLKKLQNENKDARYLMRKINSQPLVKPNVKNTNLELDNRFVDFVGGNHFWLFVRINTGNRGFIKVPIKKTAPDVKWEKRGKLKSSIRLTNNDIVLFYEVEKKTPSGNKVVGCDQGLLTTVSLSDGQISKQNNHGYDLKTILDILARKKKGSKGFKRVQEHRKNYINWSINQLDLKGVKELRLEKIKNIRKGKRSSKMLSAWTYTLIEDKFKRMSEEEGFLLKTVSNEFRSQRCSNCGWVRKANRKGKVFCCASCNYSDDSDLNASKNILLDLIEIPFWVRKNQINRSGFYWTKDGLFDSCGESIVPHAKEPNIEQISI